MKFQRIQDLRTDADMSQKQLSEILHISQRSYSHYETGSRNIPVEMLIRLANYYDISVDYLVGRTDKKEMNKFFKYKRIPVTVYVTESFYIFCIFYSFIITVSTEGWTFAPSAFVFVLIFT